MLALLLLTTVATAVAMETTPTVDTNELYKLDLTEIWSRWASMLTDCLTGFVSSTIENGQQLASGLVPYLPKITIKVTRIVNDLKQQEDVVRIFQLVQSIPKMAVECFLAKATEKFQSIGPSFDLLLTGLSQNNVLDIEGIKASLNITRLLPLFKENNFMKVEKLRESLTLEGVLRFFFETILPIIIETFVVMVARPNVYRAGLNLTSWMGAEVEDASECEVNYINTNLIPLIEYMTNE